MCVRILTTSNLVTTAESTRWECRALNGALAESAFALQAKVMLATLAGTARRSPLVSTFRTNAAMSIAKLDGEQVRWVT